MGSQEHLPLCWSSHQAEILATFQQHLSEETFVDVTLACEGASLKAHKIILSACSPYFQNLFLENPCKHPIVIIKDTDYNVLKGIVDFMYHGGINVSPDQLSEFLKTAEALKVKGLSDIRKSARLNSEANVHQHQDAQNINNSQSVSEEKSCVSPSPTVSGKQQRNRDSEVEEHYMAEESNSFSIVEVKSEPESSEEICYEQSVLPDYPPSDVSHSPAQYTISVPHSTATNISYDQSVNNELNVDISSGQQDIVMKETPSQFSDITNQNTAFNLMQNTSEDTSVAHLSTDQYDSSSISQYIPVHNAVSNASKKQDIKSESLVQFDDPLFHSSNQLCENYGARNPIIDGITGILEQKGCTLDKSTGVKNVVSKMPFGGPGTISSSSNLSNQKFSAANMLTGIPEEGGLIQRNESGDAAGKSKMFTTRKSGTSESSVAGSSNVLTAPSTLQLSGDGNNEDKGNICSHSIGWKINIQESRSNNVSFICAADFSQKVKEPQSVNCEKCRFRCSEKFTPGEREGICAAFWRLPNRAKQREFILSSVLSLEPERRRPRNKYIRYKLRESSNQYFLAKKDRMERVCLTFFLKTLCISRAYVQAAFHQKDCKIKSD